MILLLAIITAILINDVVMATTDQCSEYQFSSPFFPGRPCEDVFKKNPESHQRSGYYWITDGPTRVYCGMTYTGLSCEDIYNNHPATRDKPGFYRINVNTWTFCNMTTIVSSTNSEYITTCAGRGGGWRRIANINISAGDDCPNGWRKDTISDISFCRVVEDTNHGICSSTNFTTNRTSYQKVCGRARGYQKGWSGAFYRYHWSRQTLGIDDIYTEGLLLSYGSPRQHIWTYSIGLYDNRTDDLNCPCASGGLASPSYVGNDYYCESGTADRVDHAVYYFNDPLWDGRGCIASSCCNFTRPWFYKELSETTSSDVEARLCATDGFFARAALIDQLELYVQ